MTLQLGALRDALLEAGASPDKASRAAEEAASYETRLTRIETTVNIHTWMLSVIVAGILALIAMDVQILLRLPHLS